MYLMVYGQESVRTVSVAMAAYNGASFLPTQIDSVLSQLQEGDEFVISYDQSSDLTLNIIEEYAAKDPRIKVFKNSDLGIVGNFNNAIKNCNKDCVMVCDQDDIWLPEKRDRVVTTLNAYGPDLVIHNGIHVDSQGVPISGDFFELYRIRKGALRNFLKPRYSGCCMAFPKRTILKILPLPKTVNAYDHWIGMVCELFGGVIFLPDILLKHRLHEANATPRSSRPLQVILRARARLFLELVKRRFSWLKK